MNHEPSNEILSLYLSPPARARLLRVASKIVGDADAEDVVHEAVVRSLVKADTFRGQARVSTWMHSIVVNEALMRLRRDRRRDEVLRGGALEHLLSSNDAADPERLAIARQEAARLRSAIARLPNRQREAVHSHLRLERAAGAPGRDAAREGWPPAVGGDRSRLARAKRTLGQTLGAAYRERLAA